MEAKDFMIGDYLKTSFGVAKIISIDKVGITLENKDGEFDIDFYDEDAWMQEIPLTPKILEKNGWCSRMNGTGEFYLKEPLVDEAIVTKTIVGFQMNHGPFNGLSIHYVHELQHALRLCGIEKEITI